MTLVASTATVMPKKMIAVFDILRPASRIVALTNITTAIQVSARWSPGFSSGITVVASPVRPDRMQPIADE